MEDLPGISDTEQAAFCVELARRLNMQRIQDHLCDITLVTKDGKELKAHRNVLSAASPFFDKLLQSDMKENREGIVQISEISSALMEVVLDFIYTGSVEVTQENQSKDLIAAAHYLLIPSLKKISSQFLERKISKSNCISTFYFAEMYQCDELVANTGKFIYANFASVAEMDEFLSLQDKEVERWISSDEISVVVEADVFEIVLKWIAQNKSERKASFEKLFRHVRLAFLSRDFLIDVVTNELVEENFDCFRLLSKAIKLSGSTSKEDDSQSPRKGLETRAIVVCGGKYTFCYLPEKDEWKRLADGLLERNQDTQMMNYRDQLYAFPFDGKVERYDPMFDCWSSLDHLEWPTENAPWVTVVRGQIYCLDIDKKSTTSTIKRFNAERCSGQTVLSSHEGCRLFPCLVATGNHLFVCGGRLEDGFASKTVERFDTEENKWVEIARMQQAREGASGVATEGKIFVAGGRDNLELHSKTCGMFTILTNKWQLIGNLTVPRTMGSMICLKGALYVLGGSNQDWQSDLNVECYDPTEDKWIVKTTIPVKMISVNNKDSFTGCVLKLSKVVLDKLDVVHATK